jgi:hypothetical protein
MELELVATGDVLLLATDAMECGHLDLVSLVAHYLLVLFASKSIEVLACVVTLSQDCLHLSVVGDTPLGVCMLCLYLCRRYH